MLWYDCCMNLIDLENFLKYYFDCCDIAHDGSVIHYRHRVASIEGRLTIELYANDHNPPHFHIRYNEINASFHLHTCEYIIGKITPRDTLKVKEWHKFNKKYLIECWEKIKR